jgi:hypothetical protein
MKINEYIADLNRRNKDLWSKRRPPTDPLYESERRRLEQEAKRQKDLEKRREEIARKQRQEEEEKRERWLDEEYEPFKPMRFPKQPDSPPPSQKPWPILPGYIGSANPPTEQGLTPDKEEETRKMYDKINDLKKGSAGKQEKESAKKKDEKPYKRSIQF